MTATRQAALPFTKGAAATQSPRVRGGKGASLADMTALGLPVPSGFTIPTGISRAYYQTGCFPKRLEWHLRQNLKVMERETGRQFGNPENPLLVSVRSGAESSMPGMMDTALNIGLTHASLSGLAQLGGKRFSQDTLKRFLAQGGNLDKDPFEQLMEAVQSVVDSWWSPRAEAYRQRFHIPDWLGTAVNIQAMVYGNRDHNSGTGVVFSCNPDTGQPVLWGEFLTNAQGEDIVSGKHTPLPIEQIEQWNAVVYRQLAGYVETLTVHCGTPVDVEFTVETDQLYILQYRRAILSAPAAAIYAARQVAAGKWTRQQAVGSLPLQQLDGLRQQRFQATKAELLSSGRVMAKGQGASPGAASGRVVLTSADAVKHAKTGPVVLVRPDTSPEDLPGMLAAAAIVTVNGGSSSHAAIVARELGLPAVIGANWTTLPNTGAEVSVDGYAGLVLAGEFPLERIELTQEARLLLKWARELRSAPKLDFKHLSARFSANRLLANFYMASAMADAAKGSELENETQQLKDQIQAQTAQVLATYLVVAVAGEARHYQNSMQDSNSVKRHLKVLKTKFNLPAEGLRYTAQDEVIKALSGMNVRIQAEFAHAAAELFRKAKWRSGIGGPKWASIAHALWGYLSGRLTDALFADHVFDLRHNGNRLFDKHPMVNEATEEYRLLEQLDRRKQARSPGELHSSQREELDQAVRQLWQKGTGVGLW